MGVSLSFIFVQLWFLCAAVRPSIDEDLGDRASRLLQSDEDFGHRSSLLLHGSQAPCPEEAQQKLRGQLQGLGIEKEQQDPCRWIGIDCHHCEVRSIESYQARGDLSSVKEMTKLERLNLRDSQVRGSITELSELKNLWNIDLAHTQVTGNVTELSKLEELKLLDLTRTLVVSDLAELSKLMLKRLAKLFLAQTQVVGDVGELSNLESLSDVDLARTRVVGNLAELKLKGLTLLHLSQTQVTGNLAELSKLERLNDLDLSQTRVVGDLAALSKLERLEFLDLSQSQVVGNVSALGNLTRLKRLQLSQTQISGDLVEVSKVKELWHLDLSQTWLVGDVGELSNQSTLTYLQLSQTKVHGDISVLVRLPYLRKADFSGTAVSGDLTLLQTGCMNLRELRLGDTQVWISPGAHVSKLSGQTIFLPALHLLNVSGCHLKVSFMDMFKSLMYNPISNIIAAGCGLTGDVHFEGQSSKPLLSALQLLDVSANRLDAVLTSLANLRLDVSRNEIPLRVSPDFIKAVAKSGKELWMADTELANQEEIMANCSNELQLEQMWTARVSGGYSCHDLARRNLQVTPELFLPDVMCGCSPGHFGSGTNCSKCPKDTFNDQMNQSECRACPEGGKAPAGSQSLSGCKCPYGAPGTFENKTVCLCDSGEALSSDHECRSCGKLHLVCKAPGSLVATAPLEPGYIRLKEPSEEIFECLDPQHCRNSSCTPGRAGPLCASCAQNYRASKEVCIECKPVLSEKRLSIGSGCAATLLVVAAIVWIPRRHGPEPSPRSKCVLQLIMAQLPAMLQLTQLWTVLGGLTPAAPVGPAGVRADAQGDALFGYLEALQFTSSELQNFLALQCVYDGEAVRSLFALATPLVPLLLLIACGVAEVFSPGLGIRVGLKMLTVLFIGGASGSAQLLGCQQNDGAGTPLKEFAFRPLFPHERCEEDPWVDRIGWATSMFYGIVIPCFLGFLFGKQNVVMQKAKTVLMHTTCDDGNEGTEGTVKVWLQGLDSKQSFKDATLCKRLAAAAAACVAIDVKGRAVVELQKDAVSVTPTTNISRASGDSGVSSLIFGADAKDTKVLQRHVVAQMLMERSILEEETDRFMLGATQLFCKYAKCENVWMEVCTKVAAAALVSVVAVDNLWLCVAITLGMALVIALAQPFAQPQMNILQSTCFACLALAAVGFRHHRALAKLALAVPFVLMVLQLRRPDSPEMLALRLQQELEAKIHEGPVEVSAEQFT